MANTKATIKKSISKIKNKAKKLAKSKKAKKVAIISAATLSALGIAGIYRKLQNDRRRKSEMITYEKL